MATLLGCANINFLCQYGTYLKSPLSQVGPPLSFPESVSSPHILSLINPHFVKRFIPLFHMASPGHCHRGKGLRALSCHWERLCEGWRHSRSQEILNRVRGLGLVVAVIQGFQYRCMGVRCPRQWQCGLSPKTIRLNKRENKGRRAPDTKGQELYSSRTQPHSALRKLSSLNYYLHFTGEEL